MCGPKYILYVIALLLVPPTAATPAETKVSYAKRMAQAHMKSVGIGNFTPHQDGYSQQSSGQGRVRWQKHDSTDDEFSF